jgi:signal transduction histidine kinase/ActR/RegA family two-component response regulator
MSLMLRLLFLVLLAVLPAIAIQAYNEYDLRRSREAEIQHQVIQLTEQTAAEMSQLREGARQLLLALGELPAVKMREADSCSALFASLKQRYPSYSELDAADVDGNVFCASAPGPHANVASYYFFRQALAGDDMVLGDYWVDPVTGDKRLPFAHRFHGPDGKVAGVVYAALSLDWLSQHLEEKGLTPSGSILIADRDGTIIARLPHPEELVGGNIGAHHLPLLHKHEPGTEEATGVDGVTRIYGYVPITLPPHDLFISIGRTKSSAFADIDRATRRGIALIILGFLLAAYAAWLGGRFFIRQPIGRLLAAAQEWRNGNYGARVRLSDRGSELGSLGSAFNDMADAVARHDAEQRAAEENLRRLNTTLEERVERRTRELADANLLLKQEIEEKEQAQAALVQSQKMEAVGQLTSGLAHDFNNLLAAVLGNLEMARARVEDERMLKLLNGASRAAERGAKLVGDLLVFSRRQPLQLHPVALNGLINSMEDLLRRAIGTLVGVEKELAPDLWVANADPSQVELAILNLAINARDAMPSGGTLTLETANVSAGDSRLPEDIARGGDFVMVAMRDTGTGMSEAVVAKVFEPFFTTKDVGKGSGLGLSIVYGMAKASGGSVRLTSALGEGTVVRLFLPRSAAAVADVPVASPPLAAPAPATGLAGPAPRILLVDDDPDVREFTASSLRQWGYEVSEAVDGRAALEILERDDAIDMLVVDFAMPVMTGTDVVRQAHERRPLLPVLLITGFADAQVLTLPSSPMQILKKPFRLTDLAERIRWGLANVEAPREEAAAKQKG